MSEHALPAIEAVDLTRSLSIGIVFQSFHLIPTLTAQKNVEVPLYISVRSSQAQKLAREMLHLVGMGDRLDHRPHQLSGGEHLRVAFARALVTQPSILLADEPTGNLDSVAGQNVMKWIERLQLGFGLTLVVATHNPAVAKRADRELHLLGGRFVTPTRALGDQLCEQALAEPSLLRTGEALG